MIRHNQWDPVLGLRTAKSKESWEKSSEDQSTIVGINNKPGIKAMGTDERTADQ